MKHVYQIQMHTISPRAQHSLLVLANSRQHFSTTLRGHFEQQNDQQKGSKNVKNVALNMLQFRHPKRKGRTQPCSHL